MHNRTYQILIHTQVCNHFICEVCRFPRKIFCVSITFDEAVVRNLGEGALDRGCNRLCQALWTFLDSFPQGEVCWEWCRPFWIDTTYDPRREQCVEDCEPFANGGNARERFFQLSSRLFELFRDWLEEWHKGVKGLGQEVVFYRCRQYPPRQRLLGGKTLQYVSIVT